MVQESFNSLEKIHCRIHCPFCIIQSHMNGNSIITHASEFKKPVQVSALLLAQFSSFGKVLVDQRNYPLCLLVSMPSFRRSALAA